MCKAWVNILIYLLLPSWCAAQEHGKSFRQTALSVLQQRLQQTDPGVSGAVLKRIAHETTLSEAETRQRLLALLDTLEAARQGQTAVWQQVLSMGGEAVSPKEVGEFLGQLIKESRKVLRQEMDISLGYILTRATKKAKLPIKGKILLVQVLTLGLDAPAASVQSESSEVDSLVEAMPVKIGLMVEAHSDYGNHSIKRQAERNPRGYSGYTFLRTNQIDTVVEKMTNIHRFIFPHLLQELPRSPHIRWVVEDSTVHLKPAYLLSFEAIWLGFDSPNRGSRNRVLMPCVTAKFELQHLASGAVLFRSWVMKQGAEIPVVWKPHYCSARYNSDNAHTLDGFYREVAEQTRVLLDAFLVAH